MSEMEHSPGYMKELLARAEAEVERLRAETNDAAKLLGEKEVENIRLRAQWTDRENSIAVASRIKSVREAELEAENAELRATLVADHMGQQTPQQLLELWRATHKALQRSNARLAWFEDNWTCVKAMVLRVQEIEQAKHLRADDVLFKLAGPVINAIERGPDKPEGA
jgi:hypothetical protein